MIHPKVELRPSFFNGVVMMKSPLPTHERDLRYFPPQVSVRIHESYPVNELAEDRNAKPPVARRSRKFGGNRIPITASRVAFKIAVDKTGRRSRCVCRFL